MKVLLAIFVSLFVMGRAEALSLPLEGYFHPGRAMPVKWDVADSGSDINLSQPGAITSLVHPAGNPWGVFPWIVVNPNSVQAAHQALGPLKPVEDSDLIVVNTITEDVDLTELFPHQRIIEIRLDAGDLAGPAMAWESADAIVLTSISLQKMAAEMRDAIFAQGAELAVLGVEKPDSPLPWVRLGQWWLASPGLTLPPAVCPDAYAPTLGWPAGRSSRFRTRIVFLGAVYCLVILGICLPRWRWTPALIVAASISAAAIFAEMNRNQSPVFSQGGIVRINGDPIREDDWLFQVSHRRAPFTLPLSGDVHPIFYDQSQLADDSPLLECDQNGRPISISGILPPDNPLALMRRRLASTKSNDVIVNPATSPLRFLATARVYPGLRVAGQISSPANVASWPTVVVDHPTQ